MEDDFLKIGDQIVLHTDTGNGYLTTAGFNNADAYVQQCSKLHCSHIQNMRNMVWEVVPKLNYDIVKELRGERKRLKKLEDAPGDKGVEALAMQQRKVDNLEKKVAVHHAANQKFTQEMFGRKVLYGSPIQLLHVESGNFLQHSKRVSSIDNQNCKLEMVPVPSASRVAFSILPRYRYRQESEPVVFNDCVILYNTKFNQYLYVSEDATLEQQPNKGLKSRHRLPSPKRRQNPEEVYKRHEANMSDQFYKWIMVNYRKYKGPKEKQEFLFSGDVITLRHAETGGLLCNDQEISSKEAHDPCYVRIYKGKSEPEKLKSDNLFEVEMHQSLYMATIQKQGNLLNWKVSGNAGNNSQTVRFRHLNSGKLLTVRNLADRGNKQKGQPNTAGVTSKKQKLVLTLADCLDGEEINRRFEKIRQIEFENRFDLDFNPETNEEIQALNQSVGLESVFEIQNTIIEQAQRVQNQCVVKIKNVLYNQYVSTEIKSVSEFEDGVAAVDQEAEEAADQPDGAAGESQIDDQVREDGGGEGENLDEAENVDDMGQKFAQMQNEELENVVVNNLKLASRSGMDDVFILEKVNEEEVRTVLFVHSCVPKIKEMIYNLRRDPTKLKSPYMKSFEELLMKLVFFAVQTDSKDPFTCEGTPRKLAQKYFIDLRLLDLLIDILIYPFEAQTGSYDLEKLNQRSPIVRICQLIYRILKHCSKDNQFNKFYVAQWISHYFDQSMITSEENNLMAENTIKELLTNNKQLLDKQINASTIEKIVLNCSTSPKNERSVKLLSALCQCNGEAITSNQDNVCEFLLEQDEYKDLLMQVQQVPGTSNYFAIFTDNELRARNNGQVLKVEIQNIESYFTRPGDARFYNYFISLIELTSLMCHQRNYAGINSLERIYTLDFVIDCFLNASIPYKLRSMFAKLMIALHIDKDPLEGTNVPILTRVWGDITAGKTQIPFSKAPVNKRLLKLKEFALGFFKEANGVLRAKELDKNDFILQVLFITDNMVLLGFYQEEKEYLALLQVLIDLLDGSTDFANPEAEAAYHAEKEALEKKQKRGTVQRDQSGRYKSTEDNYLLIQIKKKIIGVLHSVVDMQNDIRLTKFLMEFNKSDAKLIANPVQSGVELTYLQNTLNGIAPDDEEYKKKLDEKVVGWLKAAFANKNLDMKAQSEKDLICVLLDILLYQESVLVNSAFILLTRYFQQKSSILKYANEVQLFQDAQEVEILVKVSAELREMKKEAESSEFWMGGTDIDHLKSARAFIDKIEKLTGLCVHTANRVLDFDDKKKKKNQDDDEQNAEEFEFLNLTELQQEWDNEDPKVCSDDEKSDEKNQRLLRNLRAHEIPLIIIRQQSLESAQDKNAYLRVLEKAYVFLIKFVRGNKENQFILVNNLELFIEDIEYGVHSWELICEIFKNSELLLSQKIERVLKKVIRLIDSLPKETQKKTTMLSFLTYFLKFNGNCVNDYQTLICVEVTSPTRKNLDHLFVEEAGLRDLHLYILEMKNSYVEFTNDERYVQEIQIPPELSYTIQYINLLATCGEGKNSITETKAQDKLPIHYIIENMALADFCYPLKSSLVHFMDSIYFEIEKDITDENVILMSKFIEIISIDLERFVEIQQRMKISKGNPGGKTQAKKPGEESQGENDLDEIHVDINKNFTVLTSFGSFQIFYLIERYIYEDVFPALIHYFDLRIPIKPDQEKFYRKFLSQIQKSANFISKDSHKDHARQLFKVIKKFPQLKEYGGDSLQSKALNDGAADAKKKKDSMSAFPQLSQAQKLTGYMKSVGTSELLQAEFEVEFEGLVLYIINITLKTEEAYKGLNTIDIKDIINALIKISDISSDIDKILRIACLKVIRKVVELENKNSLTPASTWDSEDWINFKAEIRSKQMMLLKLGVVKLVCNLVAFEQKLSIKEEALQVAAAILLGGNNDSQLAFNAYIRDDPQNAFMQSLKNMINDAFEFVKKTQIKRNNGKLKIKQLVQRIGELQGLKASGKKAKLIKIELNKLQLEKKNLEEDLMDTEYDSEENPATYTTDELTVARSIQDVFICLKIHQLFCENHNLVLQHTLREQCNEDGKLKTFSIDFPTFYTKMLEIFQKVFNKNTSDIGHQLVETLTESIQGPCQQNQQTLVNAKILDSSREYIAGFQKENEILYLGFEEAEDLESLNEFKRKIVTLLTSLLEGEVDLNIMLRMANSLDFYVMKERMVSVFTQFSLEILEVNEVDITELSLNKLNNRLKKNSFDGNIAEAFGIFILMHSLADTVKEAEAHLERAAFTPTQLKAFEFVRSHMGRIEINVNNNLQRVYYPIRPVCHYISVGYRKALMISVDRESTASKQSGLMAAVPNLIDEMNHNEELSRAVLKVTPARLMLLKDFSTLVGLAINSLYLAQAKRKYHYKDLDTPNWIDSSNKILGWVQGISSLMLIIFYGINQKKLITQKKWRQYVDENKSAGEFALIPNLDRLEAPEMSYEMTHLLLMLKGPEAPEFKDSNGEQNFGNWFTQSEFQLLNMYFFIQDNTFQYQLLYFGISVIGYLSLDIYYSFHLLDVINRVTTLQNIIKAVTQNIVQLSLTFLLLLIIVYIYTSITFYFLQDDMFMPGINGNDSDYVGANICENLMDCYLGMLVQGMRAGGGIGDMTAIIHYNDRQEHYLVKLVHDLTFMVMIKIICMKILSGITIDTFAELRAAKATIDNDMVNVCFICGFPRIVFDKYAEGMEKHIAKDHNLWMYVYYMLHLNSKHSADHSGIESYILHKYQENDISWLPRQKALCVQNIPMNEEEEEGEEEEDNGEELEIQLKDWQKTMIRLERQVSSIIFNVQKLQSREAENKAKDQKIVQE